MFTGIVEEVGRVKYLERTSGRDEADCLRVGAKRVLEGVRLGDSIAVNGVCLTVVALDDDSFSVYLAPETLRRTNLGSLGPGSGVNLERPLAVADRLGGHIVQGHIDRPRSGLSRPSQRGTACLWGFRAPKRLMPLYCGEGVCSGRWHQPYRGKKGGFILYYIRDTIYSEQHDPEAKVC